MLFCFDGVDLENANEEIGGDVFGVSKTYKADIWSIGILICEMRSFGVKSGDQLWSGVFEGSKAFLLPAQHNFLVKAYFFSESLPKNFFQRQSPIFISDLFKIQLYYIAYFAQKILFFFILILIYY